MRDAIIVVFAIVLGNFAFAVSTPVEDEALAAPAATSAEPAPAPADPCAVTLDAEGQWRTLRELRQTFGLLLEPLTWNPEEFLRAVAELKATTNALTENLQAYLTAHRQGLPGSSVALAHQVHNLRNPLGTFRNGIQLAEMFGTTSNPLPLDEDIRFVLGTFCRGLDHVFAILDRDLNKLEPELTHVESLAKDIESLGIRRFPKGKFSIVGRELMVGHIVEVDRIRFSEIFDILLANAEEAIGGVALGEVAATLRLETPDRAAALPPGTVRPVPIPDGATQFVAFNVVDNGAGMDAETLSKVGIAHFTTKATGNGLGVNYVLEVVRRLGGYVEIQSRTDGPTVFNVFFPLKEVAQ